MVRFGQFCGMASLVEHISAIVSEKFPPIGSEPRRSDVGERFGGSVELAGGHEALRADLGSLRHTQDASPWQWMSCVWAGMRRRRICRHAYRYLRHIVVAFEVMPKYGVEVGREGQRGLDLQGAREDDQQW